MSALAYSNAAPPITFGVSESRRPPWPRKRGAAPLLDALDVLFQADAACRRHGRNIARSERTLRGRVNAVAWREYLRVDCERSARSMRWLQLTARWAYAEGLRARRRR